MIPPAKAMMPLTGAVAALGLILPAPAAHPETAEPEQPPRQYRILDSQQVDLGSRSIIYNRVETPVLLPQAAPLDRGAAPVTEYAPTVEEVAEMRRWEALNHVTLFLSCTVYDDQITEVRFRHGDSDITFWSSINFHSLSQVFELQAKDTHYSLMMGIGDSTKEEFEQQKSRLGHAGKGFHWPADLLDATRTHGASTWHITSRTPLPPEARRAIEDLHAYFDAHRDALIAARAEREAAQAAQEESLRNNPPQTADTIIQYFPIRSSHSPTEARVLPSADPNKPKREQ